MHLSVAPSFTPHTHLPHLTHTPHPRTHTHTQDVATFLVGFHDTDSSGERVSLVDLLLRAIDKAFKDDSGHNDRETRAAANLLSSLFTCAKQVDSHVTITHSHVTLTHSQPM